jgi:hypothetical protein
MPHGVARNSQSPSAPNTSAAPSTPSPSFALSSIDQNPPSARTVGNTLAGAGNSAVHSPAKKIEGCGGTLVLR